MPLVKKPVTGMRDIMPEEMRIRNYAMETIRKVYRSHGYDMIETPVFESLANLTSKQGGDNEKLIFRILKRGEKLKIDEAKTQDDLSDSGLRYDLTVPLVRYYSAHKDELPVPFKAIQTGNVFRADRPQRGRFRQFRQYDIDILGEAGPVAEIDLIDATSTAVCALGFRDFTIRISDRRLLNAVSLYFGFPDEAFESVCIALDKLDKIGMDGVYEELGQIAGTYGVAAEKVPAKEEIAALFDLPADVDTLDALHAFCARLRERVDVDESAEENLSAIILGVRATAVHADAFSLVFDPTLVRGMGYYTGTIFEVSAAGYEGSIGGGGRYDKMIGKFTGQDVPACGFSLGFERIMMLLMEREEKLPYEETRTAYLIERGMDMERVTAIMKHIDRASKGDVLVTYMNKNKKHQKEQLRVLGYTKFREFFKDNDDPDGVLSE